MTKILHAKRFGAGQPLVILHGLFGMLDNWQRLHTQMQHVKNCLSAANQKNIRKIVFIHGVGTGVLKTELQNYLSQFEDYTISKADFNEYGNGATEVLIKN